MISELLTRLRFLILRKRHREFDDEIEFHLNEAIKSKIEDGLEPVEARRQALIEFGGIELTREQCERQRPGWWIGTVIQDVRYAFRGFGRNPLFTISVLITLALGIGSTTAVFSVVDLILFRPLPYAEPSRIVSLGFVHPLERQEFVMGRFYEEWQTYQTPFSALAAQSTGVHHCDLIENEPTQRSCISFQSTFLPLFGISPALGRNFLPEEDRANGPRVMMVSYGLWRGHYDADPHILNRMIDVDGNPVRIVGVLPKDFEFPTLEAADVVFPLALNPAVQQTVNGGFGESMRLFARLKPGVSVAQAFAQMQPLFNGDLKWFPPSAKSETRLSIRTLRDRQMQESRLVAWVLFCFVLAVLLIACANVSGLMMARGAGRQRELAVRSAIGASRGRLTRQALTETLVLSSAGGLAGLAVAQALVLVFVHLAPAGIPFISKAHLDLRIGVFAALISCLCAVIVGIATALQKPKLAALNAKTSMSRHHAFSRRVLVTTQIAVSIVLLSGAALLIRSFMKIEEQNLGMRTDRALTVEVTVPQLRYNTNQKVMDLYLRLESSLRRLPGTRAVAVTDSTPPGGWQDGFRFSDLHVEGKPPTPAGTGGTVVGRFVTPDYFRALNIQIFRGRNFADQDRTQQQREVILSRSLAERLFPGEDPVGKRFLDTAVSGAGAVVIGVADNVKNSGLTEESNPEMYTLRRSVSGDWSGDHLMLIVDSAMPTAMLQPWVRSEVSAIDRTIPLRMEPLNASLRRLADRPRFEATLLGFFALTGLVLSIVGLYGLIAYMTAQRAQEIGLRMALGATQSNILRLIANDGLRMVLVGSAVGLGIALVTSHVLKTMLFQVSIYDPLTYILIPLLLSSVALVAILIPAHAATRVDPAITLRAE
ncbi:ABC-type antimicrobial peptide transport system, permease component [Terriglobus roseus DSM 18391]|uniref:ABC-type antimicrobial peptide transport system, permease component n=1 Tax=Terriglobus roseus (strain DSM 18391 / NRRL B-41598 / KBS 63) TaxID=926566 RepID=I3ZJ40_TERRK|nr:ABC transporter permease [Terriglobus roseus]AFL89258.1 ABC-type antimicrobial peptide transport system, permease component [Terriglobus roseus DSM 18391]